MKINRGEMVSIMGPSGCGKTTTLRMIAGFYKPDKGKIRVLVSIFGRPTPVELEFVQVARV